ncbi:hypothetical protein DY251_12605 [Mesorhizobium denitrificans]|uniref:Uncharacterized protein n=1 Tax=Mesorhizobium denitrificans TaxID=2294114 RepID=A0A371XDT0_9HYPH|nr:hypothetical protein DY251_12605 [Mesorhizobium denitrificans]
MRDVCALGTATATALIIAPQPLEFGDPAAAKGGAFRRFSQSSPLAAHLYSRRCDFDGCGKWSKALSAQSRSGES